MAPRITDPNPYSPLGNDPDDPPKRQFRTTKAAYANGSTQKRHPLDDYPTPEGFVLPLIDRLKLGKENVVWDPCAGGGWLVQHLRQRFDTVLYNDLHFSGDDFLKGVQPEGGRVDWVITNPPYKAGEAFARKALEFTPNVAFLMNSGFLESVRRAEGLFQEYPLWEVLMNKRKMKMRDGRPSVFSHVWLVWRAEQREGTRWDWLDNSGDRLMPTGVAPGVWPEDSVEFLQATKEDEQ